MFAKLKAFFQSLFIDQITADKDLETPKPPESFVSHFKIPSYPMTDSKRKLVAELEKMIDDELTKTMPSKFKSACLNKDANTLVGMAAEALTSMKVREATNKNDGPVVEMIQKTGGGKKGYAWCMYSVQVCIAYAEKKTGIYSEVYCSGSCASVRAKSASKAISYKKSKYGDVWVWIYNTGLGHTGVFESWISDGNIAVLNEGNTTQGKSGEEIVREGGGQYQTERAVVLKKDANMRLGMVIRAF